MIGGDSKVICDISVPMNTHPSVIKECPNVIFLQGGIVKLPYNPDFLINGIPLEKGLSFACMAETMLLGLSGIKGNYSYGTITKSKVKKIMGIAKQYGFYLARAKNESSY
jgi:predicted amino acid dehydrogenase